MREEEDFTPVPEHVDVVVRFVEALKQPEERDRSKALMEVIFDNLKNKDGSKATDVEDGFKRYRNERNRQRLEQGWYALPPEVDHATQDPKPWTAKWRLTSKPGRRYWYYLKRTDQHPDFKNTGWITIFVPEGGAPAVFDVQL